MTKTIAHLVLLVLLTFHVSAQDFKKVVDIVVDMESSLKKMIDEEASKRNEEVTMLRAQIAELQTALKEQTSAASEQSASGVSDERFTALEQKLQALEQAPAMTELTTQLASLLAELRKSIDASKKQPAPPASLQVSGQVFAFLSYTGSGVEGNGSNRFDLDRVYLTAKGQLSENVKYQFTGDIFRNAAGGSYYSGLAMRLKFAMIDYTPVPSLSIKAGMIPTQWCGLVDGYWKYRGIAQTVTDRQGYFSTADLGASVTYTTPDKAYELSAFVFNGSGYTAPEGNRFKDITFRLVTAPFTSSLSLKSLVLAGYGYKGANASGSGAALQRDRFGALVSYTYAGVSCGIEYSVRTDAPTHPDTTLSGNVFSVFGEAKLPLELLGSPIAILWRYDVADPDGDKSGDGTRFMILGFSLKANDKVSLVLDHQLVTAESASLKRTDGVRISRDARTLFHVILNF